MLTVRELKEFADKKNIRVYRAKLKNIKGIAVGQSVGIDHSNLIDEREEKEVLAHEIGHIETNSFYRASDDRATKDKAEAKADEWAFNTLVPRSELAAFACAESCEDYEIAEHFGVSIAFARECVERYKTRNQEDYYEIRFPDTQLEEDDLGPYHWPSKTSSQKSSQPTLRQEGNRLD